MTRDSDLQGRACSSSSRRADDDTRFHDLVRRYAISEPDRAAIVYGEDTVTFADLIARGDKLAYRLRSFGVGPDVPVLLAAGRSCDTLVALIGILIAGGAYVPLDSAYSTERTQWMISDVGSSVLIACEDTAIVGNFRGLVLDVNGAVVRRSTDQWSVSQRADHPSSRKTLAYIIYTSGSTGRPKGVMIEHRNLTNLFAALNTAVPELISGKALRVSINASLCFDASVKQLIQLANGHTLFPVPQEQRIDPFELTDFIDKNAISVFDCVPTQLRAIRDAGRLEYLKDVVVLCGGETLDESLAMAAVDAGCTLYNVYGPTECTVDATVQRVTAPPPYANSIGHEIANVQAYVLDEMLRPVADGTEGELCIAGAGLARGYWRKAGQTARRFVANPFGSGNRLYRTGDRVQRHTDGNVRFIGRNDSQIKLHGYRIELSEIESAFRAMPGISDAAVDVKGEPGLETLVSYVVATDSRFDPALLRRGLSQSLPSYMIPSEIVTLDALPKTSNGKIDRSRLPDTKRPDQLAADTLPQVNLGGAWPMRSLSMTGHCSVVCVPDRYSPALSYTWLADSLSDIASVTVLSPVGAARSICGDSNIDGLVILQAQVLRNHFRHQNIVLLGHGFGALIAADIARHLSSEAIEVTLILLAPYQVDEVLMRTQFTSPTAVTLLRELQRHPDLRNLSLVDLVALERQHLRYVESYCPNTSYLKETTVIAPSAASRDETLLRRWCGGAIIRYDVLSDEHISPQDQASVTDIIASALAP